MSYDVKQIDYRDAYGKLLWSEPMQFKNLHGIGEELCAKGIWYVVKRVALADTVQHVNISETRKKPTR